MKTAWITPLADGLGLLILLLLHATAVAGRSALVRIRLSLFRDELLADPKFRPWHLRMIDRGDGFDRILIFLQSVYVIGYALVLFDFVGWVGGLPIGAQLPGLAFALALLSFVLALVLFYTLGQLVPRAAGLAKPVGTFTKVATPLQIQVLLFRPMVRVFDDLSRLLARLFGVQGLGGLASLEIEQQVEAKTGSPSTGITRVIMRNALKMRELELQDILLPRNQVQYFDIEDGNSFNLDLARKTGHTRFPLCEGDLDHCIGIIHIKDVFRLNQPVESLDFRRIKRAVLQVKPEDSLEETLMRLLRQKTHMALVADEFGGVTGLVTLEQILEELVGDIQDEFDFEEALIQPVADDVFLVSGLTAIHDLEEELNVDLDVLDTDGITTFGGLITSELGRIPQAREEFDLHHLHIAITEADEKRVIAARVRVTRGGSEEDVMQEDAS